MTVAEMTQTETAIVVDEKLAQKFADALNAKLSDENCSYSVSPGRKYDKITVQSYTQLSVHAFVERKTGLLYKPAGWAAPAKGARYDLSTDEGFARAVEIADRFGSYLYVR